MAKIHWTTAINANFNTAGDWSTGTVPGASDDAILDAKGAAFDVTASTSETVNSIQLASNATLSITGGTFTANAGTGSGANAGLIVIGSRTAFTVTGAVNNTGSINLNGAGNYGATLLVNTAGATLTGGGQVVSSTTGAGNFIEGAAASDILTNFNDTISGSGALGNGSLTLINDAAGVIDATGGMTLNTSGENVTNAGLIEATNGATLTIQNTTVDDSIGGTITAATGSNVNLQNADIIGGTLATGGTGVVLVAQSSTFDGSKFSVNNTGTVDIGARTALTIQGTIANSSTGLINVDGGGNYGAGLIAGASNATLTGGQIILNDFGGNFIEGALSGPNGSQTVSKLTNTTTISGAGNFGEDQLSLVNTGVVDATGANALIIDTGGGNAAGSNTVANSGLLEATNPGSLSATGGLTLRSIAVANGTTGVVEANGAASHVDLQSADIIGGTLKALNGGVIQAVDGGSVLDGATNAVNNTGVVDIGSRDALAIQGTINNTGSINLNGAGNYGATLLVNTAGATLTGGGQVVSSTTGAGNFIEGAAASDILTNFNDTISGSGALGNGSLTLINDAAGVIDATGGMTINTSGENVTNAGLIEATNGATLTIQNTTVDDSTGGTITAATGSNVNLQNAHIIGGTLVTGGTGVVLVAQSSTFDGSKFSVNNIGTVDVGGRQALTIQGTIANSKTASINVNGGGNYGAGLIAGAANAILTGGQIILNDFGGNFIEGTVSGPSGSQTVSKLTNRTTISGAGNFGEDQLSLVNTGVVDATGANALIIDTGGGNAAGSNTVANSGLLEATNPGSLSATGGLTLRSVAVANGTTGVVEANGAASHVDLQSADIIGGTLKALNGGVIQAVDGGSVLDGATNAVNNTGVVDIGSRDALAIQGTINNTGSINLNGAGNYGATLLVNTAGATLTGGGQVVSSTTGAGNFIEGAAASDILTNFNDTISGSGALGNGSLTLINDAAGVIDATDGMTLNTSGENVTNAGLIEASNGATLTIQNTAVDGSTGGTISAANGSTVVLQNADIIGGALVTAGTGVVLSQGGTLDGTTSTLTNAATIDINSRQTLTIQGAINNTGSINLDGSGNYGAVLTFDGANVTLTGSGAIVLNGFGGNQINGSTATTTLSNDGNTLEGSGQLFSSDVTLINGAGGIVDGNQAAALVLSTPGRTITNMGTLEGTGAGGLVVSGSTVVGTNGTIFAGAGSSVTLQSATVTGGSMSTAATGEITIGNGSTVTLDAVTSDAGTISVGSTGSLTSLIFDANTSLSGGGVVELSGNKNNIVDGTKTSVMLTNVDDTIEGAGKFGDNKLILVNDAAGVIDADSALGLIIGTQTNTIVNAGLIEATGKGKGTLTSAVDNTGTLEADNGLLTINAVVTGAGSAVINDGTLTFDASVTENIAFTGTTGKLVLGDSLGYTGQVSGFSLKGRTSLDLEDVGFVASTEATYSGTASGGVLTVTDGTHTAHINLVGNYLNSTFVASSDGHGGVKVVDPSAPQSPPQAPGTHAMVAAMASLGASPAMVCATAGARPAGDFASLIAPRINEA